MSTMGGYDLAALGFPDVVDVAGRIQAASAAAGSLEEAAQGIVGVLREAFVDPATGESAFVLARMFLTQECAALPEEIQGVLPEGTAPATRCLTLLATDGEEPTWRDRRGSRGHQAIPLPSPEVLRQAPMVAALIEQLDVHPDDVIRGTASDVAITRADFDVFHVPEAVGSPLVPAQDFVREYGVRSVLGCGGLLPHGDLFALVLFSRTQIPRATAEVFRTFAVSAKLALLDLAAQPVFAGGAPRPTDRMLVVRSRVAALQQLLAVQAEVTRIQESRLRQEADLVETLHEVGSSLTAELNLDRLVEKATDAVVAVTGAQFGAFFYNVTDDRGDSYLLYTISGVDRSAFENFPMPRPTAIFQPTFSGSEVMRSDDITKDARYGHSEPYRGMPKGHLPVRSYLAVPVISGSGSGEVLGGFFVGHEDPGVFTSRHERLVVGIAAQTAIASDNARLYQQQRDAAVQLQRALMPQDLPDLEGVDVAFRYLPGAEGTEVGGDWFDVIPLSSGRTAFVIGDVMGRGLHAAAVMGQLRTAVRALAVVDLHPADLIGHLNELVNALPGHQIATCVYAVYDPAAETLEIGNAGHPPPLLITPESGAALVEGEPDAPLGTPDRTFRTLLRSFPAGSSLLLYTDGLVERRDRSIDDGLRALTECVTADASPKQVCDTLVAELVGSASSDDDVALLVARTTPEAVPRMARREFPGDLSSARPARRWVREVLEDWCLLELEDLVQPVVGELIANALEHAGTSIDVRLLGFEQRLTVEVSDHDPRGVRMTATSPTDERHRGLLIVDRMASRWGSRSTSHGKVVWAEFDRS